MTSAEPLALRWKVAALTAGVTGAGLAVLDALVLAGGGSASALPGGGPEGLVAATAAVWAAGTALSFLGAAWIESGRRAALERWRREGEEAAEAARRGQAAAARALTEAEARLREAREALARATRGGDAARQGLAPAVENLASQHGMLLASATRQSRQAAGIRGLSEAMASALDAVIRNAADGLKMANLAVENARNGGEVVNKTVKHMNAITITVASSAKIIRELGERSKGIGEIIRVIDDIADQTNLLALNAAIEAARAGEQGRGFAVVADEVRKLAERTTIATKEIASTIRAIQAETSSAVQAMDEGIKEVDKGAGLAVQAGVWLQKIVGGARQVADMISEIAASSRTQSDSAGRMSADVSRLVESAEATLVEARGALEAASALSGGLEALSRAGDPAPAAAAAGPAKDAPGPGPAGTAGGPK
jgi:methyl-accepting chemotaxis protein